MFPLFIAAVLSGSLQSSALASGQVALVDYSYTAVPFQITNENVSKVKSVDTGDNGAQVFTVQLGVCRAKVVGAGIMRIRVHGATGGVFHVGQLIATGGAMIGQKVVPAVRAINAADIKKLGCPTL